MRRRSRILLVAAIALAALLLWRSGEDRPPAPGTAQGPASTPPPPARAPSPAAEKRSMPSPAIQLAKAVTVRPVPELAPGALEGMVVDAATDAGIPGAELTFSHDNGAYSTTTGGGGAFRFAPNRIGAYRLVSVTARGYASFEGEFGSSPVSFTSMAGKDVSGVVLRLSPEEKRRGHRRGGRNRDEADGGDRSAAAAAGSLRGRVVDGRTGAPVAAFAVALWQREGIALSRMMAPASFIDPSGAYEITGLSPGTYEAVAMAAGYAWSTYAVVQIVDSPVEANFSLRAGARIEGVVTDDATRRPLAGAVVSLEGRRGVAPDLPVAPVSPEAETDGEGRFALDHVPPDAVSLSVARQGYLVRLVSLGPLSEDGVAQRLSIALTPRESGDGGPRVELTGIGAVLRARDDVLEIQQVVPNAGAADAGLARGDEIVSIDGSAVTALGFERAIAAIRGPEGTTVALRIRRAGRLSEVIVTRKLVRS